MMPDCSEHVCFRQRPVRQVRGCGPGPQQQVDQACSPQQPCRPGVISKSSHGRARCSDLADLLGCEPGNLMLKDSCHGARGGRRVSKRTLGGPCAVGTGDRDDSESGAKRCSCYLGDELTAAFQGYLTAVRDEQPGLARG